ncbi:uncharacterized protein LOC106650209 [Trichogramma pretiosum]|uniref:uncharacterized protein LOC106650209 n=1 Tax=Trichogramma pretiosum TaxID=7493 RepID=UPI0006C987BB|nr:uncharacterized protein LOC106650209 [Trichogramma pretiosum]
MGDKQSDKFQYLRGYISAATEYAKHQNETDAAAIQRNLAAISATSDLSIFEPGSSIVAIFYVSLHELMNSIGSRSSLIWSLVDVLQTACKNSNARFALVHTYKFAPLLAKLLEANLTSEKRIRALKLMQDLTYGINISWQEAHLPYLIKTLSNWVTQSNEEEVITLSLGVLVNLCYKNLPAVYALMRSVNTKTFLQSVVRTRGQNINVRVQCCKLLIILEHSNSEILESYILDVAAVTFTNIIPTLKSEDVLLLRHIVDFFDDIRQNERFRTVLLTYSKYNLDVKNIIETVTSVSNQECIGLIIDFLLSLVKLKVPHLMELYPVIVKAAISKVSLKNVGSKALALIKAIIVDSRRTKINVDVLEELDFSLLNLLINEEEMEVDSDENYANNEKTLSELMQLLQELVKTPAIRTKVLEIFTVQKVRFLLKSVLEYNNDTQLLDKPTDLFNDTSTDFHIHALAFIADLAINNTHWLTLYTELLQKKQMQIIMAVALFSGDSEVKQKVLQLTSTVGFPQECISAVARCMSELEPLMLVREKNVTKIPESLINNHDSLPLITMVQEGRLDAFLDRLREAFENNKLSDIMTSSIMELYEYKMAAMKHAERSMQSSLEASTNHATRLQHRLAQVIAQSSQLHQLLFNTQQCLEGSQIEKAALMKKIIETEENTKKTHSTQNQEICSLKKIVVEKDHQISRFSAHIKELESKNEEIPILIAKTNDLESTVEKMKNQLKQATSKNQELTKLLQKLQESLSRKDQVIEEKNREILSNQNDIAALNQEIKAQVQQCHSYQMTIAEKEESVQKLQSELHNLSRMRDMIFELTAKKKDDL